MKEREALHAERCTLSEKLAAASQQLDKQGKELTRLRQVESECLRLQNELAEATIAVADLETRLRQMEVRCRIVHAHSILFEFMC